VALPLYDIALSFAGEQRDYVRAVASCLRQTEVTYFFDEDNRVDLWGRNLVDVLDRTYRHNARFVVMFVSRTYAEKVWPNLERQSAQSRAIEEVEPYILPVRFDDTDLSGLQRSISYVDGRQTDPEELAELIEAKVAQTKNDPQPEDREPGWEYLLFINELTSAIDGYDRDWRNFELGLVQPRGAAIAMEQLSNDFAARTAAARKIVGNINRLLNDTTVTSAFGAPGEEGDPERIRHLAGGVADVYASLLDWAAATRGALVPDEAEPVLWALSDFVRAPLLQIREFVHQLDEGLRPAIEELRAGRGPDEPVTLTFSLTLSIDEEAQTRFEEELATLEGHLRPSR
jgi:hypothetical protein